MVDVRKQFENSPTIALIQIHKAVSSIIKDREHKIFHQLKVNDRAVLKHPERKEIGGYVIGKKIRKISFRGDDGLLYNVRAIFLEKEAIDGKEKKQ